MSTSTSTLEFEQELKQERWKKLTTSIYERERLFKEEILSRKEEEKIFTATVREDLDAVENEALRNTVIVKKLKTDKKTSTDKVTMGLLVQQEARSLVKEILGTEDDIAYTGLLFTGKDGLRATEGLLPPFKIAFKTKEKGILFREIVVQKSKDVNDKLHKTYFTCQQCQGTRIRTLLMWALVDKIKNPKKGIDAWVNQSINKPTLQVKGEEKNQKSYTFVNAMLKYEDKLEEKAKEEALKLAKKFFQGQVEKVYIVIKEWNHCKGCPKIDYTDTIIVELQIKPYSLKNTHHTTPLKRIMYKQEEKKKHAR